MSTTALPALPSQSFPTPVSPALSAKLDAAGRSVPAGEHGAFGLSATKKGGEVSLGYRISPKWTAGAWVGVEWRGSYDYGLRVSGTW